MRSFGSDNHSGVHPQIMQAIEKVNTNHAIAYGNDFWSEQAREKIKEIFGNEAEVFFVFNGTGANMVSLQALTQSFHAIVAPQTGHIVVDECGATEFMCRAALKTVETKNGKLSLDQITPFLNNIGNEHHSQPKVAYISQCSELGTVYSTEETSALANFLHQHNMYLYMDGARIANAAVSLNKSFKEITTDCGVDILSFGGTKNGMMMGEAVMVLRKELADNLQYIRKQSAQLFSKMRYVSAQFLAYFDNDLWHKNAQHANNMAQLLRNEIAAIDDFVFTQQTDANIVLVQMPKRIIEQLLKNHFFYIWNESLNEIRLVTSWDTTEKDIALFISNLKKAYHP